MSSCGQILLGLTFKLCIFFPLKIRVFHVFCLKMNIYQEVIIINEYTFKLDNKI
jgi:hypothetical protein